jgi:hypothetical protein
VGLPQVHNGELRIGIAERHGFVGELIVIMTLRMRLIGVLAVFKGDIKAVMLNEAACLAYALLFIAHEHKSVGDPERKLVERDLLLAHEGQELELARGELAHEHAALGDELP